MKIFVAILILFVVLLPGCRLAALSPPDWIIGTWSDEFSINTWTFTKDNAVYTLEEKIFNLKNTSGDLVMGAKEPITFSFREGGKEPGHKITDEFTSLIYIINMEYREQILQFKFVKTSKDYLNNFTIEVGVSKDGPIILIRR